MSDPDLDAVAHWSTYGQPGTPPLTRFVPTPEERAAFVPIIQPESAKWRYGLDGSQTEGLLRGYQARVMEEKWDIWAEDSGPSESGGGATSVSFCRSWTGRTIVRVDLQLIDAGSTDAGSRVVRGTWETAPTHLTTPSEQFARETFETCCAWVLGIARPTPSTT